MKTFKPTFWRGNPQLKNGGYYFEKTVTAKTENGARRKAKEWEKDVYGSTSLSKVEEVAE